MTEIKADEKLRRVMERTMFNLRFVHERRADSGPYEVVQLVNSFSGAMVHPWEVLKEPDSLGLKNVSLAEARLRGWPVLNKRHPSDAEPANYHKMLQWIRNAFAHGNVEFEKLDGHIARIRIWNCPPQQPPNWTAVVSVDDMEDFLWFFYDLALGQLPKPSADHPRILSHAAD
jgi:hypothetical protein